MFQHAQTMLNTHIDDVQILLSQKEHEIQSKHVLPYARIKNYSKKAWRT